MKMRIIPLLFAVPLLTGCTDIRSRLSPDVLAIETGSPARASAVAWFRPLPPGNRRSFVDEIVSPRWTKCGTE